MCIIPPMNSVVRTVMLSHPHDRCISTQHDAPSMLLAFASFVCVHNMISPQCTRICNMEFHACTDRVYPQHAVCTHMLSTSSSFRPMEKKTHEHPIWSGIFLYIYMYIHIHNAQKWDKTTCCWGDGVKSWLSKTVCSCQSSGWFISFINDNILHTKRFDFFLWQ